MMFDYNTNLYEYPIILLKAEIGKALTPTVANEIWDSLTDEEKELNNHISLEKVDNEYCIINKDTKEILRHISTG